jgi:hypothetical protein
MPGLPPLGGPAAPAHTAQNAPIQSVTPPADIKGATSAKDAVAGATGSFALPDAAQGVASLKSLLTQLFDMIKQLITMLGSNFNITPPTQWDPKNVAPAAGGWWRP